MKAKKTWETTGIGFVGGVRNTRFDFIDLFAGIGGFRIALERLGGKCVCAVEWDKFARETYAAWFGAAPDGCDINDVDYASIPAHDILTAGFPCPAYSIAGVSKRKSLGRASGLDAEKDGRHIFTLAEILVACRPPAFIFENVGNLLRHDKGKTWDIVHSRLVEAGYSVSTKLFNAKYFGVPQNRERVIIVGFDIDRFGDDPGFQFPEPDGRIVTILSDILEPCPDPKYTLSDKLWEYLQEYKREHSAKGNGFGYSLAPLDGVTRTLSARYHKDGSEILVPQPCSNPRRLTPREAARLMGFPDHLPIVVSDTRAYMQFGNAVVPAIIETVGAEVLKVLERHPIAAQADWTKSRLAG